MTIKAAKRQQFNDVPVKEVENELHISEPTIDRLKGKVLMVTVGTGKTQYTIKHRDDFSSGVTLNLFNGINNKTQRWEIA